MKGIIWYCSKIRYKDTKKSTRPKELPKDITFTEKEFKNCILVFSCIERGDTEQELDGAVNRVDGLKKEQFYKTNHIVIAPFAHLSNKLEEPSRAQEMCTKLMAKFKQIRYETDILTFGTHKYLLLEFFGHRGSASYFEFPYPGP